MKEFHENIKKFLLNKLNSKDYFTKNSNKTIIFIK